MQLSLGGCLAGVEWVEGQDKPRGGGRTSPEGGADFSHILPGSSRTSDPSLSQRQEDFSGSKGGCYRRGQIAPLGPSVLLPSDPSPRQGQMPIGSPHWPGLVPATPGIPTKRGCPVSTLGPL